MNDTAWSARAGLRKETLSRLRRRPSCDLATLEALLAAVGSQLAEQLHPGASEPAVFAKWLTRSALRPSRFMPMLENAAEHTA